MGTVCSSAVAMAASPWSSFPRPVLPQDRTQGQVANSTEEETAYFLWVYNITLLSHLFVLPQPLSSQILRGTPKEVEVCVMHYVSM